jgi:ABC-2 type transport system ATP-binding protein
MASAIETDGLTKRYGSGADAVHAVSDLSLRVERGEVFGFLGPNGAGKSTTIDLLLDYVRPTAGSATVLGHDAHADAERVRERVGVLPEGFGLYDRLTGRRHLEFAAEWADADGVDVGALLSRVGLDPGDADRPAGDYSKGMCNRLALAMALVGDPDLLILDEPASGLDPNGVRRLREIVRAEADRGTTVFFSSHVLGQVEAVCDRVGILDDGELVAVDTVDGLREAVGAGSELRLRLPEGASVDVDVDVAAVEGVERVRRAGTRLHVTPEHPRAKARVVARLWTAGVEVLDVDSEGVSLEDVFAAYTGDGAPVAAESDAGEPDRAEVRAR